MATFSAIVLIHGYIIYVLYLLEHTVFTGKIGTGGFGPQSEGKTLLL